MRLIVAIAAALVLGAACDTGGGVQDPVPVNPNGGVAAPTETPTADEPTGEGSSGGLETAGTEDEGVETSTPDPRLQEGAWCPGLECTLEPTDDGEWDCTPLVGNADGDELAEACWPELDA